MPTHSVSVAAAIVDRDGRALAIRRRDNGRWEPPGGVLELAEPIEDGLIREVLEETGLVIRPLRLTGVYKNMARGIIALVFRCEAVKQDTVVGEEVIELRWLEPGEISNWMDEAYAIRILDALDDAPPRVRAHDGTVLKRGK